MDTRGRVGLMQFLPWLLLASSITILCFPGFAEEAMVTADNCMKLGQAAYDHGSFEEAAAQWRQAAHLYEAQRNQQGRINALVSLGAVYQSLGEERLAHGVLEQAGQIAEGSPGNPLLLVDHNQLGVTCGCLAQFHEAERILRETLAAARNTGDTNLAAAVLNNLGNLEFTQNNIDDALATFTESAKLAQQVGNRLLAAKALANAAAVAAHESRDADADGLNSNARAQLGDLTSSHDLALVLLRCGRTDWQLSRRGSADQDRHLAEAESSYQQASIIAERLHDKRALTYALGYLGQIREAKGDLSAALDLTRRAAFCAQEIQLPNALYEWEWQMGRLAQARGNGVAAVAAYRRALQTLEPIRRDLLYSHGPTDTTFREAIGPLYSALTDGLLEQAGATHDPAKIQQLLRQACDNIEQFNAVEIEDYLQDRCVTLRRAQATRIENIGQNTAVIYIIPLANRTELIVGIGSKLKRFQAPIGVDRLSAVVQTFRLHLGNRTTNEYLGEARELYGWLIAPIRDLLSTNNIQTLVFVPDGVLRTIPMAALEDGQRFLFEQYAIAVSPGLTLLEPHPVHWSQAQALVAGVAESIQGQAPLLYVDAEIDTVKKLFNGRVLLDHEFVLPRLKQEFARTQYQIVHLASHGQIDRDASNSYILTDDGKLTLDELEGLLRPSQFHGRPVELLTLSACQTAAGDDRAALGLAGVALKAGARSALATLWSVHDESTALLMDEFYSQLKGGNQITRAKALQLAQLKLLRDPRFEHPGYWAPYLIIGDWL